MTKLFKEPDNIFKWGEIETSFIRTQYNEMLNFVMTQYEAQYPIPPLPASQERPSGQPSFLNRNNCLTIEPCNGREIYQGAIGEKVSLETTKTIADVEKILFTAEKNHGDSKDSFYKALTQYENAVDKNRNTANDSTNAALVAAQTALNIATEKMKTTDEALKLANYRGCLDSGLIDGRIIKLFLMPNIVYDRKLSLPPSNLDFSFSTSGLTVGAVIWLYFYERMGIFKILGALLDDYNYRGKYTISGRRSIPTSYSRLMDMISTLHRVGISSNLRDRICLYQRVLGVSIENNLGIESERNTGFMNTFNRLLDYQLEYYKAKQLAQAIQAQQTGSPQPRSSVATQTSIRDTISVLKQHFEPLQYGRNQINTFVGIATVHATLCLVSMLRSEIGIPAQYEKPEEFIPAAYDILVAKKSHTLNEANRFIIYDNCASYGYRLLTDIETIDLNQLTTIATGSTLDTWLNDIEGLVEGYRNAYSAVPEKVEAIV